MSAYWMDVRCKICKNMVDEQLEDLRDSLAGEELNGILKYKFDVLNSILENRDEEVSVFSEHCANPECEHHSEPEFNGKQKPLQIIDGQHRTRGMNAWENYRMLFPEYSGSCPHHSNKTQCDADGCTSWQEMDEVITEAVPVTISHFNNQKGDQENKAAIFLEVNTKAEDLSPFHKLAMLYRERFPPTTIKNWPGSKDTFAPKTFDFSSENSPDYLRYQFILHLCSRTELYPFHNAIPILKVIESNVNVTIIDVRDLWIYLEKWNEESRVFSTQGCFNSTQSMENSARVFAEYFQAWSYHLTGPLDKNATNTNAPHFWAPSHPLADAENWGLGDGGWAWKRAVALCPTSKTANEIGNVGDAQQDQDDKERGIWALTGYMRFILDFFEPVCSTILSEHMDEQEGDQSWSASEYDTGGGHNGIHNSLGFDSFREKIEQLLTEFPFEGAIFHSKGYGLKESERNSTIALVCNRLQWVI